ncbi:MAG: cation:proton antiporter, partial [Candidatus Omnitrophica bacterium]|nr:cation:proton antiporter [Candidatus Omnitrophota bacterium]
SLFFFCSPAFANETAAGSESMVAHASLLVFQISVILFAAWTGGALFNRFRLPSVLGEVLSGVIIGPFMLGKIPLPAFPLGLFPMTAGFAVSTELYSLAAIASVILLFLVGIETDLELLFRYSVKGLVVGIGGVVASFVLGDLVGVLFGNLLFGRHLGFAHPVPLLLGVISTATSVGITARILSDKRKMDSPEGVTILSAAVIDDVLGIILFAIVVGVIKSGHVVWREVSMISLKAISLWLGFTALGIAFSGHLSRFLKGFKDRTTIAVMAFALALFLAGIFERSGLAMIIGAYVMGLSLSKTDISFLLQENLASLNKFFVPLFFCVMGMLINLREMSDPRILLLGLIYVVFAIVGKLLGCSVPALFMNFTAAGALRVGLGMIPRGEVALIIAGIGLALGAIPHDVFSVAVIMTFITTLITPPVLAKTLDWKAPSLRKNQPPAKVLRQIVYDMPNQETGELLLGKIVTDFENEGFFVYRVEIPEVMYQIRKNDVFITLKYFMDKLVFECSDNDTAFVHTVFYEVIAELEELMSRLEKISNREKIAQNIFCDETGTCKERIKLSQVISPLAVSANLKGSSKSEILEEMITLLMVSGALPADNRAQALKDLWEREKTMSTGMQEGVALPHAKTLAVDKLIAAVGIKNGGADFDSLDKKPSEIFVLTLAPKANQQPYLQFMGEVTKVLVNPENRKRILSSRTNKDLYKAITASL